MGKIFRAGQPPAGAELSFISGAGQLCKAPDGAGDDRVSNVAGASCSRGPKRELEAPATFSPCKNSQNPRMKFPRACERFV